MVMVIGSIAINLRLTCADFPLCRKHYVNSLHHHESYGSGTKRFGAQDLSKGEKRKRMEKHFVPASNCPTTSGSISKASANVLAFVEQLIEQLLNTSPNCSSYHFLCVFWQSRCSETFCTSVAWLMMVEGFDVMLSGFFTRVGKWWQSNQWQHWTFYSCVNWFMTPNVEFQTLTTCYIIVFGNKTL